MDSIGHILKEKKDSRFFIERDDGFLSQNYLNDWISEKPVINSWEKKILSNIKSGNVIDIGCGTGKHVEYLCDMGFKAYGIDNSQGVISIGKTYNRNIDFVDFWNLSDDIKYDNVVLMDCSIGFIESPENLVAFFKKISRIISKSGNLLITSVNWQNTNNPEHLNYISKNIKTKNYPGNVKLRLKSNSFIGDWFNWVWIDMDLLVQTAILNGFYPRWIDTEKNKYAIVFENSFNNAPLFQRQYFSNIENSEWLIRDELNYPYLNQSFISFNSFSDNQKRVVQIGPYRVSFKVTENPNIVEYELLLEIAQKLKDSFNLDLMVGGSQSPLSNKKPTMFSDIDLYIPVDIKSYQNISQIEKNLSLFFNEYDNLNISFSIIDEKWLCLPFFCESCSPIREKILWFSTKESCFEIYEERMIVSISKLQEQPIDEILTSIENYLGFKINRKDIINIVVTPRWHGLQDKHINRIKAIIQNDTTNS